MSEFPRTKFDEFLDDSFLNLKIAIQARHDDELSRIRKLAETAVGRSPSGVVCTGEQADDIESSSSMLSASSPPAKRAFLGNRSNHEMGSLPGIVELVRNEFQSEFALVVGAVENLKSVTATQAEIDGLRSELAHWREGAQGTGQTDRLPKVWNLSPLVDYSNPSSRNVSRRQSRVGLSPSSRRQSLISPGQSQEFGSRGMLSASISKDGSFRPPSKRFLSKPKFNAKPALTEEEVSPSVLRKRLHGLLDASDGLHGSDSSSPNRPFLLSALEPSPTIVSTLNAPDLYPISPCGASAPPRIDGFAGPLLETDGTDSTNSFTTISHPFRPQSEEPPSPVALQFDIGGEVQFALLDGWKKDSDAAPNTSVDYRLSAEFTTMLNVSPEYDSERPFRISPDVAFCGLWPILPKGACKVSWDLLCTVLVGYDTFVLPLHFLDMDEVTLVVLISWLSRCFWTLDIPLSFSTGYTRYDGNYEMRPRLIARRYCRTWLSFDLILVMLDWGQLVFSELDSTAGRLGRASRFVRLLRLVRLIRILRLARVLRTVFESLVMSEKMTILANITLSLIAIVALMHFIGCVWYGLGQSSDNGWVKVQKVEDESFWTRYGYSLFWAAGLFTGNLDPVPFTGEERTFITIIMFFFFVVATTFISTFTSSITQFMVLTHSRQVQITVLRRYMKQHSISQKLCLRVMRNAKHVLDEQQQKTPEDEVELLKVISEPLRRDLQHEMYGRTLVTHTLFQYMNKNCVPMMKKICSNALRFYNFSQSDVLFSPGEIPPCQVLLLHTGEFRYSFGDMGFSSGPERVKTLQAGQWICEPALWTSWVYRGLLRAAVDCQVMVVSGEVIMQINEQSQYIDLAIYGQLYVKELARSSRACSDLADEVGISELVWKAYAKEEEFLTRSKNVSMRAQASVRGSIVSLSALIPGR